MLGLGGLGALDHVRDFLQFGAGAAIRFAEGGVVKIGGLAGRGGGGAGAGAHTDIFQRIGKQGRNPFGKLSGDAGGGERVFSTGVHAGRVVGLLAQADQDDALRRHTGHLVQNQRRTWARAEFRFDNGADGAIACTIKQIGGGAENIVGVDADGQGCRFDLMWRGGGLCAKFHENSRVRYRNAVDYPAYFLMSLFKRSVVSEITSHAGVVFSTLVVVWLSVLLVRLLGEAAGGSIGADVVFGLAALSTITALPTILPVSLFIAVLTTVTRNYRESEMVVWFASGLSLADWLRPVLRVAVPVAVMVAVLTLLASPWAYRQMGEYRQRYEQRSDLSKVTAGQFVESSGGSRVFFAEDPSQPGDELGNVFARAIDPEWLSVLTAESARGETQPNGDRFLVLGAGHRYDLKPGTTELRLARFEQYGFRLEGKGDSDPNGQARLAAERSSKGRPTSLLIQDNNNPSWSQIMWRVSMPLAALNLALLAIPLGAVNPRLGRSGDLLMAGLVGLLYMNLINLSRAWISAGKISFGLGVSLVHIAVGALAAYLMYRRLRIKAPKHYAKT